MVEITNQFTAQHLQTVYLTLINTYKTIYFTIHGFQQFIELQLPTHSFKTLIKNSPKDLNKWELNEQQPKTYFLGCHTISK